MMNNSSSSLKVTVNGKKYLITGIQKETSCKGLLCAIAKVTSKEEFHLRSSSPSLKNGAVKSSANENLLERFKGDRELAGDITSLNVFNSLGGDAKIIVKDTVPKHKEHIIADDSQHILQQIQQVQPSNSKHSHSVKRRSSGSKKQKHKQDSIKENSSGAPTKEETTKSEKKAKQKLFKRLQKEKEKKEEEKQTIPIAEKFHLLETHASTKYSTTKRNNHKVNKKHRSVDDSDIESYKRENLLRHKTKKRTYYDDSDIDVYKTLERIVIDQTKKLHKIQTHTKEVKRNAWMKELTRNSQVYFIDEVVADANGNIADFNGHIIKPGGGETTVNHINTDTCLFEKDDGNDSGLPSPEYDSSESQENQPIKIKDNLPRDMLNNTIKQLNQQQKQQQQQQENGILSTEENIKINNVILPSSRITSANTIAEHSAIQQQQTTKELQILTIKNENSKDNNIINNKDDNTEKFVVKTTDNKKVDDTVSTNITEVQHQDKKDLYTLEHRDQLTTTQAQHQLNTAATITHEKNIQEATNTGQYSDNINSICNPNNISIVATRKEEIITFPSIETVSTTDNNKNATRTQHLNHYNLSNEDEDQRVLKNETSSVSSLVNQEELLPASEIIIIGDTESTNVFNSLSVNRLPTELVNNNSAENQNKKECNAILTIVDKNENILLSSSSTSLTTTTTTDQQHIVEQEEKEGQEIDKYFTTMKLDKNRNYLSESKCELQVSKMVAFNDALFKGSVSSPTIINSCSSGNAAKKFDKKKLKKSDISDPVLLSPGSFKKHQSLKKVQSVLGKQAADVLKRDILKSLPQQLYNKNGEFSLLLKDEKSEQKEKEKHYNKKLKEIRRSKKGKKSTKDSSTKNSSSKDDDTEYLPRSRFTDLTSAKAIFTSPEEQDSTSTPPTLSTEAATKLEENLMKSNSVTDGYFITQQNLLLNTTEKVIGEIDGCIVKAVTNDSNKEKVVDSLDEEDGHITSSITEATDEMYEKTYQQNLTADEIFNEILEYERNIKNELDEIIIQADQEEEEINQNNNNQKQQQHKQNKNKKKASLKINPDLSSTTTTTATPTTATTKTKTKSPRLVKDNIVTTSSNTLKSPQHDLVNKQENRNNKLSSTTSKTSSSTKQTELNNNTKSSGKNQKQFSSTTNTQHAEQNTTSETNGSTEDGTRMSLIKDYLREKEALDDLSEKLSDYNHLLSKLTDELEIFTLEQDQSKSIKDLEDDEKQIYKEIENIKSMLRSVSDLTSYQRKEMSENLEILDNMDIEIRTRKANYENLRNGTWRTNSQSAPRSLIKNVKVKRRNAHLGIASDDHSQQQNRKSSSFV